MKRFLALLLALGLMTALAACDKVPNEAKPDGGDPVSSSQPSGGDSSDDVILPDEDGFAEGYMGDTLRTYFFDFTVNSAYTCSEFEGYTPSEGNTLLVAEVSFYNYTSSSVPMYDTDLQAQWSGTGDQDFAVPITFARTDLYPNTGVEPMGDMFPMEFNLGIHQGQTGLLVYEVPAGESDYSLSYMELFDDDTTGDTFFVYFTPEAK